MRSIFSAKLLFGIALLVGCSRPRAQSPVTVEGGNVGKALAAIAARHHIPGIAAIALRGDRVVAQGVAGVRKAGSLERITIDDKFHLGSDTKAMTATLIAMLVEEGKLTWTTTLGEVFGGDIPEMQPEWKAVTLQHVLAHRAGLPRDPSVVLRRQLEASDQPLPVQRRAVVAEAMSAKPDFTPGSKFNYSNTGYILLGAVIEKITTRPWEDVIRERLFRPLGITSSGFGAPGTPGKLDQPWGHETNGAAYDPGDRNSDNPRFYGPAGTVHMTVADWSRFAALHLRGDPANPHPQFALLKSESFAALHTPLFDGDYAGGWGLVTRSWANGERATDQGRAFSHAGSNTKWFCVVWLAPEIDFAVLVACNKAGGEATKACDEVTSALIHEFAPKPSSRK